MHLLNARKDSENQRPRHIYTYTERERKRDTKKTGCTCTYICIEYSRAHCTHNVLRKGKQRKNEIENSQGKNDNERNIF